MNQAKYMLLYGSLLTLIAGCSVKICNCGTREKSETTKSVDSNSTLVEFTITPKSN